MIKLKTLHFNNFLSYKSLEFNIADRGIVSVGGMNTDAVISDSNGAGKSALFEGIVYALFGQTLRGVKGDDVIRRDGDKTCGVELDFSIGEDSYKVGRYRKHKEFGSSLRLWKNAKDISRVTIAETQETVEQTIDIDYITFCNSLVFFGNNAGSIADGTETFRKQLFSKILGLDIYDKCSVNAKEKLSKAKHDKLENDRILLGLNERFQVKEEGIKRTFDRIRLLTEKINKDVEVIDCERIESKYQEKSELFDSLNEELQELQLTVVSASSDMKCQVEELTSKIAVSNSEQSALLRDKRGITSQSNICPILSVECDRIFDQKIVDERIKKIDDQLAVVGSLIESTTAEKKVLADEVSKEAAEINTNIFNLKKKMDDAREEKNLLYDELRRVQDVEAGIAADKKLLGSYEESFESDSSDCDELTNKIADAEAVNKISLEAEAEIEFWIKAFGNKGIPNMILSEIFPYLNHRLNYYSDNILHKSIVITNKTLLKSGSEVDKIDILIDGVSYQGCSMGERRRIDTCILFAIQDLVMMRKNKFNVLFIDEIFDVLDETGVDLVLDLINDKMNGSGLESIFVISHNNNIVSRLDKQIYVTKTNNLSEIVEL